MESATSSDYADRFRCIGPDCEDTCCQGWQITLDHSALIQLQKLPDPALQAILKNQLVPHPAGSPATQVAHFRLTDDHRCPCLRTDHLCSIQAQHGEQFLPLGCQLFPRVRNRIDQVLESSLSLACPEAARLVLADPQLFRAFAHSPDDLLASILNSIRAEAIVSNDPTPAAHFWPLRQLHLAILLDRTRSLNHRLILLGQLARLMDKESSLRLILDGFRPLLRHQPANADTTPAPALLAFVFQSLDNALAANSQHTRLRDLVSGFLAAMQYTPLSTEASLAARFRTLRDESLDPFLAQHPYLLENYFANQIIRDLYPFGTHSQSTPAYFRQFSNLLLQWTILRVVFAGLAGQHRSQLTPNHLIAATQTLARAILHNPLPSLQPAFLDLLQTLPLNALLAL